MNDKGFIPDLTKEIVLEMSKDFNFENFFNTNPHIALITITQYDVIIVYAHTANENFKRHSDLQMKIYKLMSQLNRLKYSMMTFRCSSMESSKQAIFSMADLAGGKRVNTKEMIEAMKLIHKYISLIDKDNRIQKGKMEDIIEYNNICETENIDYEADAEIIGVPIKDFIKDIKEKILKISPNYGTYSGKSNSFER